jgi:hypothetical protein
VIFAYSRFKIDVAEKRPRPLVPASHPSAPAKRKTTESYRDSVGQRLFELMFAVKGFEQALAFWFSPAL